jgi:hypothetical protein
MRGRSQTAQSVDAGHDEPHLGIVGDEAFAAQFAEGTWSAH